MFQLFCFKLSSDFFENPKLSFEKVPEINNKEELVQQLKEICKDGKEIFPEQSAQIFYKLGQLYCNQTTDMIKLIQSAALYNAAIARLPDNIYVIENDLKQLCNLVLSFANAKNLSADLIIASKQVKKAIAQMRHKVQKKLISLKYIENFKGIYEADTDFESFKIKSIKKYQNKIAENYTSIMANLAKYCENVMGKPPCKFAIVGMGSLARKEITPYSDFEHIIVLEEMSKEKASDEKSLNYFKWFSVIFHIVLINLQETILPSVVIQGLNSPDDNWFFDRITKRGICFDGMLPHACKFPLGRQQHTENKQWTTELIKPISEMLKYLTIEEDIKNGYHLKDILTKVCFVYGKKSVFKKFRDLIIRMLSNQDKEEKLNEIKKQIVDDLESFTVSFNTFKLKSGRSINIKKLFYRSITLFITALGRIHNIFGLSCFDIIEELAVKKIVSRYAKQKLMFAVALACELRLTWYMKCKRQNDTIESDSKGKTEVEILLDLVGKSNIFLFFQITYALQCDVSKQLALKKKYFYTNPNILTCNLHLVFGNIKDINSEPIPSIEANFNPFHNQKNFDEAMKQYEVAEKKVKERRKLTMESGYKGLAATFHDIGVSLLEMNKHHEAFDYLQRAIKIKEQVCLNLTTDKSFTATLYIIGRCLLDMNKPFEALHYLQRELKIKEQVSLDFNTDNSFAETLHTIGRCLLEMNKHNDALNYLQRAMKIKEQVSLDLSFDKSFAATLHTIGHCLLDMNKHDEALDYLQQAMKIDEQVSFDLNTDKNVAVSLHAMGVCLIDMNKHDEAMDYLQLALKIKEQVSSDLKRDTSFAATLHAMGVCLLDINKHDESLEYLRVLKIKEEMSVELHTDKILTKTLRNNMNKHDKALHYLQQALKIKEQVSLDLNRDKSFATTLHTIGRCLLDMNNYEEALNYLKRAMKIEEQVSLNLSRNESFAITLHEIGRCLLNMNKYDEALDYLQRALKIEEQMSLNLNTDESLAATLYTIGRCLLNMNKHDEALNYLQRALKNEEQISLNLNTNESLAATLYTTGCCLLDMNKCDEALGYLQRAWKIKEQVSMNLNTNLSLQQHCTQSGTA